MKPHRRPPDKGWSWHEICSGDGAKPNQAPLTTTSFNVMKSEDLSISLPNSQSRAKCFNIYCPSTHSLPPKVIILV